MNAVRIDFQSADAARFNQLRDQWRSAAASCALSRSALRVASVLPTFVNREFGYAFPSDEAIADAIGANPKTVKRGLGSLDEFHLIERVTKAYRNANGAVGGKRRQIYLTLPLPKGQFGLEPKGHSPKGQEAPKGQNRADRRDRIEPTEGTPVCPNILDGTPDGTLDKDFAYERAELIEGTYPRDDPSAVDGAEEKKEHASSELIEVRAAPAFSPPQEPNSYLSAKDGDGGFAAQEKKAGAVPSAGFAPSPDPSVRWQDAWHPKVKQGQPLSRVPFPAPRSEAAAHAFFRKHHVPETEWPRLLPDLMDGYLYEYDIEPWMDAA